MTPNFLPQQCPGMEPLHHLGLKLNSGPAGNMMSICHRIHRMVLRDIFGSASKPTKHLTNPQLRPKHVELSNDKEVSTSRSSPWLLPKLKQVDYQRTTYCVACSGNHSSKTLGYGGPSLFIIAIVYPNHHLIDAKGTPSAKYWVETRRDQNSHTDTSCDDKGTHKTIL